MNDTCIIRGLDGSLPTPRSARADERRIELVPNRAVSVDAVRGTVVRSLRGSIWLTQEGRRQDYILVAGMSYVSLDAGRIVLSAPDQASAASVYRIELAPGERTCGARLHVGDGTIARIERDAQRARAVEMSRWFGLLADALAGAWRRLKERDKPAAPRARNISA